MKRTFLVTLAALLLATSALAGPNKDIVDTAVAAGNFTTLAKALTAAGLVDTLKGAGPFTVFAPTDEAFAKLPAGTVDELLKPENKEKLVAILTYHVVPGKVLAQDVVKMNDAKTVNGKNVKIMAHTAAKSWSTTPPLPKRTSRPRMGSSTSSTPYFSPNSEAVPSATGWEPVFQPDFYL